MSVSLLRVSILLAAACLSLLAQSPLLFNPSSVQVSSEAGSSAPIVRTVKLQSSLTVSFLAASSQPSWLEIWPASGTVSPGPGNDITLTIKPQGFQTGVYTGWVTATPQNGGQSVILNVTLNVTGLTLFTSPSTAAMTTYPEGIDILPMSITSSDGVIRDVSWTLSTTSGGDWLSIRESAPVQTPATITLYADATNLDIGVYTGEIRLTSTSLPGFLKIIPVTFDVRDDAPRIRVVPTEVRFYTFGTLDPPPQPIQVYSNTDLATAFSVTPNQTSTIVMASPLAGQTPSAVKLSLDTAQLGALPRSDSFVVTPIHGGTPVTVKVQTAIEPKRRKAIPQIADGGGFRTRITIVNADNVPARVSLKFFKVNPATRDTVAWTPALTGNPIITNVTIPVGASWSVITSGADAAISSGWGEVISDQRVSGNAVFQFLQPDGRVQEAAVPVSDALMQRLLLPFDNSNGFVTSFALINLSATESADIRVAFRDDKGKLIRFDRMTELPAGGHFAIELTNLFPYLNGLRGTMDLSATTGHISLLGLRFNPTGAFTSFEAQSFNRRETGRRTLPQIADGGDFKTAITLVNQDFLTAYVTLKFHKSTAGNNTTDWNLKFDNGATSSSTILIPPCSTVTLRTTGESPVVEQGWGEIFSTGYWVSGFAVFEQRIAGRPDQEAAVPINYAAPRRVLLPFDNTSIFTTSVALANLSETAPMDINLIFRDSAGQRITTKNLVIPTLGHKAFNLVAEYPDLQGLSGAVEFSALTGEPSALGLRFTNTGAYTTFKAAALQ